MSRSRSSSPSYPHVSREKLRELDRLAIEKYHIPSMVLMENAGAGAARIILEKIADGPVVVVCGKGNNGGDGLVIARHLYNHHVPLTTFFLGKLGDISPNSDPGLELRILLAMGIVPVEINDLAALRQQRPTFDQAEVLVDAIFGTGLQGPIREPMCGMMHELASWQRPTIAVDIPSGLDANTGEVLGSALPAFLTITFCLPKLGFKCGHGPRLTGEVAVVEISIPRDLWEN